MKALAFVALLCVGAASLRGQWLLASPELANDFLT
jgi:hypothetical protein